ncbi:MAG: hypothetical protein H7318_03875 [Oligoflexus sp.]|nr:hypothetical protein [Oligoflexus sp.]
MNKTLTDMIDSFLDKYRQAFRSDRAEAVLHFAEVPRLTYGIRKFFTEKNAKR